MSITNLFQTLINSVTTIASSGWVGIAAMVLAALGVGGGLIFFAKKINSATDAADTNNANDDSGATGQAIQQQIIANQNAINGMAGTDPVLPPVIPPSAPSAVPTPVITPPQAVSPPVVAPPVPAPAPVPAPVVPTPAVLSCALPWDGLNKQAPDWTKAILSLISRSKLPDIAYSDITLWFPKWASWSRSQRIIALASLFAKTVKYESDYNPACSTVDAGTEGDKDTWSVGLLQVSVVDEKNYGLTFGYDFAALQDGVKNINLSIAIAEKLCSEDKMLCSKTAGGVWKGLARYWGTLRIGRHSYDMVNGYCKTLVPLQKN